MPCDVQQTMSGEKTPLLSGAVPMFGELIDGWRDVILKLPYTKPLVTIGLTWAREYSDRMDRTMAFAVAMCTFHVT
jgi:hypothetical protein